MNRLYLSKYCPPFLFILMLCGICLINPANAMGRPPAGDVADINRTEVTGTVKDANGQGLAGATIRSKNGPQATSSDANGNFKLHLTEDNPVRVVSFVGYL